MNRTFLVGFSVRYIHHVCHLRINCGPYRTQTAITPCKGIVLFIYTIRPIIFCSGNGTRTRTSSLKGWSTKPVIKIPPFFFLRVWRELNPRAWFCRPLPKPLDHTPIRVCSSNRIWTHTMAARAPCANRYTTEEYSLLALQDSNLWQKWIPYQSQNLTS